MIKLNLASGKDYREGYVNVDDLSMSENECDLQADIKEMTWEYGTVDEILLSHFMMYVDTFEAPVLFNKFWRWLKPGGKLIIVTGDLKKVAQNILDSDNPSIINGTNGAMQLFGWANTKGHTWAWCYETLAPLLKDAGFEMAEVLHNSWKGRADRDITLTLIKI